MSSDSPENRKWSPTGNRKKEMSDEKKKGEIGGMGRTDWEQLKWLVTLV